MAMYVYRDEERKVELYAKDSYKENKSTRFYCPNPNCDAHMFICSLDGSSSAYFRATHKAHSHIDGCMFTSFNKFKLDKYDEVLFNFETALKSMLIPSKKAIKKIDNAKHKNHRKTVTAGGNQLKTIREIYSMCKSYGCHDIYNNVKIGQMLLDDRSCHMYSDGILGYRIIEAKVPKYFYDKEIQTINLCTPVKTIKYKLQLMVSDKKLFREMRDNLFNNSDKIIIVGGEWQVTETLNMFSAIITSNK